MSQRLRVDRLELRLRGWSAHRARELAAELGRGLPRALEGQLDGGRARGPREVARVEPAPVRVARGAPARDTADAIARAVAGAVDDGGEARWRS
jgi:hypothetical protein